MPTNPTTLRLGDELEAWLTDNANRCMTGPSLARRVRIELTIWKGTQEAELRRLRFSLGEIGLLADVMNGTVIPDAWDARPPLCAIEVMDATSGDMAGLYGDKWGVDELTLIDKLRHLWPTADYALAHAINRWWATEAGHTPDGWATVGLTITNQPQPPQDDATIEGPLGGVYATATYPHQDDDGD